MSTALFLKFFSSHSRILSVYLTIVGSNYRQGRYKLIWGQEGASDGWGESSNYAWRLPWNLKFLGMEHTERPESLSYYTITQQEMALWKRLVALGAFDLSDINSGFTRLFDLEGMFLFAF